MVTAGECWVLTFTRSALPASQTQGSSHEPVVSVSLKPWGHRRDYIWYYFEDFLKKNDSGGSVQQRDLQSKCWLLCNVIFFPSKTIEVSPIFSVPSKRYHELEGENIGSVRVTTPASLLAGWLGFNLSFRQGCLKGCRASASQREICVTDFLF